MKNLILDPIKNTEVQSPKLNKSKINSVEIMKKIKNETTLIWENNKVANSLDVEHKIEYAKPVNVMIGEKRN